MNLSTSLPSDLPDGSVPSPMDIVQQMLDASLNGMLACEVIRDNEPGGMVGELRLVMINWVAADELGKPLADLIGRPVNEVLPTLAASPLYDQLVEVAHTGIPGRLTSPEVIRTYPEARQYDSIITRVGSLVVLAYNDITDRDRAEQVVLQQTNRLRFVTDNALTAIVLYSIVYDPVTGAVSDLRYEFVNRMAERMVNRVAADLVGNTMRQSFPGIDQTPIWRAYMKLAETGETLRFQNHYTLQQFDIWYEVQGVREDNRIVLSFQDITELKRAQERIERQNDEFRQVLDNALTGISHCTSVREEQADGSPGPIVDFVYQAFNRAAELISGKQADTVIGRRMLELFPDRYYSGTFQRWVDLVNTQGTIRFQEQRPGTDRWLDTQAVAWHDGFIQSYVDVTPIKQAELEQQRQTELINSLLTVAPIVFTQYVAVRNSEGQLLDYELVRANQMAAEALGIPLDQLIGQRMTAISPIVRVGSAYDLYVEVTTTGKPVQFEWQSGDKWYQVSLVRFGDGFVSAAVDVTDSRLHRQQLEVMNNELLRSNDSLQQFAYVASHDLQEPLRKIQAFGDLLAEQYAGQLDSFGQDFIGRIKSASARMSLLITDLLTYSRIGVDRHPFQPVDLDHIVTDVLSDLEVRIQETQAVIDREQLPTIVGDPTQLRQLFQNLISNALKFQHSAGEQAIPRIHISCQHEVIGGHSWYNISVSDNGIGFEQKYADRIFQVFQRLHNRQAYTGTGVGLAICKRVAETHGGTLTAHSEPGKGATFLIRLPG